MVISQLMPGFLFFFFYGPLQTQQIITTSNPVSRAGVRRVGMVCSVI